MSLPKEWRPSQEMRDAAKLIDKQYMNMYETIKEADPDAEAADVIALISWMTAERISLLIGEGLSEYDVSCLKSVIERHVAGVVYRE